MSPLEFEALKGKVIKESREALREAAPMAMVNLPNYMFMVGFIRGHTEATLYGLDALFRLSQNQTKMNEELLENLQKLQGVINDAGDRTAPGSRMDEGVF